MKYFIAYVLLIAVMTYAGQKDWKYQDPKNNSVQSNLPKPMPTPEMYEDEFPPHHDVQHIKAKKKKSKKLKIMKPLNQKLEPIPAIVD